MERVVAVIEPILTPIVVVALSTMGGWGVWVSMGTYDANNHLNDYEEIVSELRTTVGDLRDVQLDLAKQEVTVENAISEQTDVLNQILSAVR